jgi:hypothetical protein
MKRAFLLLLFATGLALAQTSGDKVLVELKNTDDVIAKVKPLIEQSPVPEAKQLFAKALEIQAGAWRAYNNRRPSVAMGLTMDAREKAKRAGAMASVNPDRVRKEVKRTRELLTEFTPEIVKANNPRANELWKMALAEQKTAEDWLAQNRFGLAGKFTMAAREHGKLALGIVRGQTRPDPEHIEKELRRTDALIEKVSAQLKLTSNRPMEQVLAKAIDLQRQAWQAWNEKRLWQALRLTFACREMLMRAWEGGRPKLTPELVEQALAENESLIRDWSEPIRKLGDNKASNLLDAAVKHQEAGRKFMEQRQLRPALNEAKQARKLLKQAIQLIQTDAGPDQPR